MLASTAPPSLRHDFDAVLQTPELCLVGDRVAQGVAVLVNADFLEDRDLLGDYDPFAELGYLPLKGLLALAELVDVLVGGLASLGYVLFSGSTASTRSRTASLSSSSVSF